MPTWPWAPVSCDQVDTWLQPPGVGVRLPAQPVTEQTSPEDSPLVLLRRLRVHPDVPTCDLGPGLYQVTHFPGPPRSTDFTGSSRSGTDPTTLASLKSLVGNSSRVYVGAGNLGLSEFFFRWVDRMEAIPEVKHSDLTHLDLSSAG